MRNPLRFCYDCTGTGGGTDEKAGTEGISISAEMSRTKKTQPEQDEDKRPPWFKFWRRNRRQLDTEVLDMESRAVVFTNMMRYLDGEEELMPMTPIQAFAFNILKGDIDDNCEEYERTANRNRENAKKRAAANSSQSEPVAAAGAEERSQKEEERSQKEEGRSQKEEGRGQKEEGRGQKAEGRRKKGEEKGECAEGERGHTQRVFHPPTMEEVAAYCAERNNGIQAQRFVDFYAAKGWRIGKETMRDWKAAVRVWEGKEAEERAGTVVSGHAQNRAEEVRFDIRYDVG